jgi:colanic acid biosynthesis protein WcaH
MKPLPLSKEQFLEVIDRTPLVSIDLVIKDPKNKILLGLRNNEPAKGKWFVPGGRIMKGENLDEAFKRISKDEIGFEHSLGEALLIGAFTHLYETNFCLKEGITTHYVVLAYELLISDKTELTKIEQHELKETEQHNKYKFISAEEADPQLSKSVLYDVHENTLAYFRVLSKINEHQN